MRKAEHLPTFTADIASALGGPDWLRERRLEGFEAFSKQDLPSEAEEVWRYSPIDSLDLESYRPSVVEDGLGPADQSPSAPHCASCATGRSSPSNGATSPRA
jgi:hypothetical protein